ncbi:hypothetical protein K5M76_09505 [Shewanella xiamenensis]|uniref:hypothetical protein n=1 Tax=Shewanella xiamenensis TaxID=332186 RepID=UPI00217E7318|nr:hypothetical protein [Shewanella xiamenensis]MCT8857556.1 hypothetical protein [Shewanella xiamenensis]UWG66425.1 hypothetical protein K5M76_09505 [Shewanella xiamenensis]
MNDKEWEELLKARFEELRTAIQDLNLIDFDNLECRDAVRSIVGVKLDERNFHLMSLAMALNERRGEGSMTLDEAVTHLNNLPLGLRIAELQRAEVLDSDKVLAEAVEMQQQAAKSLEQLCEDYEAGLVEGKHAPEAVAYIMALEDLVSELQGKSFRDGSMISALESKLESFENLKHEHEEQLKHNRIVRVENGRLESENESLREIVVNQALLIKQRNADVEPVSLEMLLPS